MFIRSALIVALTTVSTIAIAQTTPPANTPSNPAQSPAAATTTAPNKAGAATTTPSPTANAATSTTGMSIDKGMQMANSATVAVRFVTVKPADFMTSRLVGTTVYNNQNESLGEIEDLVVDNGKAISGVVVSVGGFLGIGDSYVVLDPSTLVLNQKDGSWRAYVDTTKDNLKNAPKFKYSKKQS